MAQALMAHVLRCSDHSSGGYVRSSYRSTVVTENHVKIVVGAYLHRLQLFPSSNHVLRTYTCRSLQERQSPKCTSQYFAGSRRTDLPGQLRAFTFVITVAEAANIVSVSHCEDRVAIQRFSRSSDWRSWTAFPRRRVQRLVCKAK